MPEDNVRTEDVSRGEPNADLLARYRNIARAYRDVHVLTKREYKKIEEMDNVDEINDIIGPIAQMDNDLLGRFCVAFIGDDTENFNNAPVAILARAYIAKQQKGRRRIFSRNSDDAMAVALAKRIDEMSEDFANSGGMVLNNGDNKWPLVDINNIANVYESFSMALKARIADLDETTDAEKIAQMKSNIAQLDAVVSDYDKDKGLNKVHAEDVPKLDSRWDEIMGILNNVELSPETLDALKKYNFLDENGKVIPQFLEDGQLDREGRAAAILDLLRGDVARRHVVNGKIDEEELTQELNDAFLIELYKIEHIDELKKIVNENPEMFMNAEQREEFMNGLDLVGGNISNDTYNDVLDSNVNATAGWGARLANKIGLVGGKNGGFFDKMFHKNERVDSFANMRMSRKAVDRRQRTIQIVKRILKGFGAALIASILVMTIASAIAANAGISVAMAAASIGVVGSLGISGLQIGRWRRAQRAAGAPTNFKAFLKNKRLLSSLVVSGIAMFAMGAGAFGMASTSLVLGFIALGLGALKNGAEMYTDVRDADKGILEALKIARDKFKSGNSLKDAFEEYRKARHAEGSVIKSLALGITNAGSVIAGGFTGRALVNVFIDWFNTLFPDNKIFQNVSSHLEKQEFTKEVERSKTVTDYTDEMTQKAEAAVNYWYRNNPELLQQNLDAINQYNLENGTDINPYRALRIIDMCDPNRHGTYTAAGWQRDYGFTPEQINMVAHAIGPDGTVNPEAMEIIKDLDLHHMGKYGEVGAVRGHEIRPGDVYRGIKELPTQRVEKWMETETDYRDVPVQDYNRVNGVNNMATVGNYESSKTKHNRIKDFWKSINEEKVGGKRSRNPRGGEMDIIEPVFDEEDFKELESPSRPNFNDEDVIHFISDEPDLKENISTTDEVYTLDPENTPVIEPVLDEEEYVYEDKPRETYTSDSPNTDEIVDTKSDNVDLEAKEPSLDEVYTLDPENTPVIEPVSEEPELSNVYDNIAPHEKVTEEPVVGPIGYTNALGLTRSQAKAWRDLNHNLTRIEDKINKERIGASDLRKLESKRKDILREIQRLSNKFGDHDYEEITKAAYEELLRETLNEKSMLMKLLSSDDLGRWEAIDIKSKIARIDNEIAELTKELARQSEIFVQKQEHEKQKAEKRVVYREFVASLPQKVEKFNLMESLRRAIHRKKKDYWPGRKYEVPPALEELATRSDLTEKPISSLHGLPVYLMDLGGNKNPFTQNDGCPIVVVEIKQDVIRDGIEDTDVLHLPFYLSTGTEGKASRPTGHWYPLSDIRNDGRMFVREKYSPQDLMRIAHDLDQKIGDVRNWYDDSLSEKRELDGKNGLVGGSDVIQHVDPETIIKIVGNTVYDGKALYGLGAMGASVDEQWMASALADMEEIEEKKLKIQKKEQRTQRRTERRAKRRENIEKAGHTLSNWVKSLAIDTKYFDEDDDRER